MELFKGWLPLKRMRSVQAGTLRDAEAWLLSNQTLDIHC